MKILYTPNIKWNKSPPVNFGRETVLSLSGNNWDDYDYKTTLNAKLIFDGKVLDFHFNLKILIRNSTYTAETLNELCSSGWDGHFPIPKLDYISIPSDIDFYKSLIAKIGPQNTEKTLEILHDASILSHSEKHPSYSLTNDDGFKLSLLRESGAHKAYLDGWKVLKGELSEVKNFTLFMQSRTGEKKEIPFQFESSL
ncbi:TPA: hypothetical protein ACSPZ6_002395, partial [Aeromonas hydrophila]